jgi:putative ABC transport system substrate-binding protein
VIASALRESNAQPRVTSPVIGLLDGGERLEWWAAFRQQMQELGYVEGKTVAFESRFARGKFDQLPSLAEDLVRRKVAAIVTSGRVATQAAMRATGTIPIVMATGDDPVQAGLVASLGRPGGNVTGVTSLSVGLMGKRFELLTQLLPKLTRLAVLFNRANPTAPATLRELEATSAGANVTLQLVGVQSGAGVADAFAAMTRERARAVIVIADPMLYSERRRIADLALKHHLPSIHGVAEYVEAGGLLSYGPSYSGLFRRAAVYLDKILKGAKPAELPIEQPTQISLLINLKTARALGVTIPPSLLMRAERVIE